MEKSVSTSKWTTKNRKNVRTSHKFLSFTKLIFTYTFRKTQELIEPMRETLKEIEYNMKTHLDKICQAKLQIMKNDQRIQTLLNGNV